MRATTRTATAPSAAAQRPAAVARRAVLAVPLLWAAAARAEGPPPAPRAGGVDEASSPLIAEMLRKTEAQREARVRERLDAYYVKNFKGKRSAVYLDILAL